MRPSARRLAVAAAPLGLHEQCDQISAFAGGLKLSSPTAVPVNPAPDARPLREVFAPAATRAGSADVGALPGVTWSPHGPSSASAAGRCRFRTCDRVSSLSGCCWRWRQRRWASWQPGLWPCRGEGRARLRPALSLSLVLCSVLPGRLGRARAADEVSHRRGEPGNQRGRDEGQDAEPDDRQRQRRKHFGALAPSDAR